jgi:hypothetical protein
VPVRFPVPKLFSNGETVVLQVEKNPTIVNFPVKNLLLKDVVPVPNGAEHATA